MAFQRGLQPALCSIDGRVLVLVRHVQASALAAVVSVGEWQKNTIFPSVSAVS